jgi:hypothetical protein
MLVINAAIAARHLLQISDVISALLKVIPTISAVSIVMRCLDTNLFPPSTLKYADMSR